MRWFTALAVLLALAVTPALSLVCDTRCLDAAHAHGAAASATSAHQHSHGGHHGTVTRPADATTVAALPSGTTRCAAHVEQAVPAAPRQWAGACAPLGPESVSPIVREARLDLPTVFDVRPLQAPPRLSVPLRI